MGESWYKRILPQVKDIKPIIGKLAENIATIPGVEGVYVFGSFAENIDTPNHRIKDIDIIAKVPFCSEDLVSIDRGTLSIKVSSLEEEGFDEDAVKFSKSYTNINQPAIDHWVISSDNKILHWGPIITGREESDDFNKEAEEYASDDTGVSRNKLARSSEDTRTNWYLSFNSYVNLHLSDMPSGWYQSDVSDVKDIIDNAIKLV